MPTKVFDRVFKKRVSKGFIYLTPNPSPRGRGEQKAVDH
jgi:hypothetical protein